MRTSFISFCVTLFFCVSAQTSLLSAQTQVAPIPPEKVGLTGWRVGFSNALYLTAPANLKSGGVEWSGSTPSFLPMSWSAQNADVRVEVARGAASRFEELRKAAFVRIGGTGAGGRNFKLDTYDAAQFALDGKTATVARHGIYCWAIVILPTKSTAAAAVANEVLQSLWLERVEKPEWKDRVVGYSWQAEMPYELSEEYSDSNNTERYRARWGDFSVETLKGGAYTDFDKTVAGHVEALQKRADFKNVRVQRFTRAFGYLAKERGVAAQIDFLRGDEPHRIYKIATVTGYGALFTTITLKPKKPEHLAWAHRILSTLRLGYGVPGDNYKPVILNGEPISFESEVPFGAAKGDDELRTFVGNDQRNFLFSIGLGDEIIIPLSGEMPRLGALTSDSMIGNFLRGAGGKLTQKTILPYAVGAFPARRVRFEADFNGRTFFGDALSVLGAQRIYLPLYLTETATNDKMPRAASTWRFNFPAPAGWKIQNSAGGFQVLLPEKFKATTENDRIVSEAEQDGVRVRVESLREDFPDEITLSFDGLTEGEKADNPIETDYGALFRLKQRMEKNYGFHWARTSIGDAQGVAGWGAATDLSRQQDTIVLRNATHWWVCEMTWNPRDKKSRATRDAVLASIRCDLNAGPINGPASTPPAVTPAPNAPIPSTPLPAKPEDETDDWGWGWWF